MTGVGDEHTPPRPRRERVPVTLASEYLEELGRRSDACAALSSGNLLGAWPRMGYMFAGGSMSSTSSAGASSSSSSRLAPPPTSFKATASPEVDEMSPPTSSQHAAAATTTSAAQQSRPPLTGPQFGYYPPVLVHRKAPPRIPEKCLTWCSQKDGQPAMCRMLCLRKREPLPTQAEALAKLRPQDVSDDHQGQQRQYASPGIFESMRARLAPYSIIYVKGTAEGVVGRYMEELEADDGQHDFGPWSRHAPEAVRRKGANKMQVLNWGEDVGLIAHLPLTSIFWPVLNLPENVHRFLDPPSRFVDKYIASFSDGTQTRALERLSAEIKEGGAITLLRKMVDFRLRQWETAAAADAERHAQKEADDKAKIARENDEQ